MYLIQAVSLSILRHIGGFFGSYFTRKKISTRFEVKIKYQFRHFILIKNLKKLSC